MNHKLTLWPSLAAVIIFLAPLFISHCEKKSEPEPIIKFRLIDPGLPDIPVPPILPQPLPHPLEPNLSFNVYG
jgi:hypothetical protein